MHTERRGFVRSLLALSAALMISLPVAAQKSDQEFTMVDPVQPTDNPAKIEVLEFFSYGCPHCSDFNPIISAWAAKLPADVDFKKVPVSFDRGAWSNLARIYYALEATGDLKKLDGDVFKAIHEERTNLVDEKTLSDWVAKKGADPKKFMDAYKSFGVLSKAKRADQISRSYHIEGVPTLAINGKYMVTGKEHKEMLSITDKLIGRTRSERAKK